jgi:avirulence protein
VGCFQSKAQSVVPPTPRVTSDDRLRAPESDARTAHQHPSGDSVYGNELRLSLSSRESMAGLAPRSQRPAQRSQSAPMLSGAQAQMQTPTARMSQGPNLSSGGAVLPPRAGLPQGTLRSPGSSSSPHSIHSARLSIASSSAANLPSAGVAAAGSMTARATAHRTPPLSMAVELKNMGLESNPASRLPLEQQTLIGVARWPNRDPSVDKDQRKYGLAFSNKSLELAKEIKNGDIKNLDELWAKSRDWRCSTLPADDLAAKRFATSRTENLGATAFTPIYQSSRYAFMAPRVKDLVESGGNGMKTMKEQRTQDVTFYCLTSTLKLKENKPVELTKVMINFDSAHEKFEHGVGQANSQNTHTDPVQRYYGIENKMIHTDADHVPALMERTNNIFQHIKQGDVAPADRMNGLAEVHWLLAQAMPDERGSAAKSEMVVRSIAGALDMELPPFKQGKVPDLEAFMMPLEQFKKEYPNLLEQVGSKEDEAKLLAAAESRAQSAQPNRHDLQA